MAVTNKPEFILGTVQFGLDYGIANKSGKPAKEHVFEILDTAYAKGVRYLDTAAAYGDSEKVIGEWIASRKIGDVKIISKLPAVGDNEKEVKAIVNAKLEKSLEALNVKSLYGYLLHSAKDYSQHKQEIDTIFRSMLDNGAVERVGASLYSPDEITIDDKTPLNFFQVPFNLFDTRFRLWLTLDCVSMMVRSVFLQGLFFLSPDELTRKLPESVPMIKRLNDTAKKFDMDIAEMAIAFVISFPNIFGVVFGVESIRQFESNFDKFCCACPLEKGQVDYIMHEFNAVPDSVYNPILWKKKGR